MQKHGLYLGHCQTCKRSTKNRLAQHLRDRHLYIQTHQPFQYSDSFLGFILDSVPNFKVKQKFIFLKYFSFFRDYIKLIF